MIRASLVAVLVACSSSGNNGSPDATGANGDGSPNSGTDGSTLLPSGVYAIPLTTPDDSFWGPQLTIGSQTFMMSLDTGSTTVGVAGSTCAKCDVTPLYSPGASAMDQHETASTSYDDNSGWSGEIYQDTVGLGHGSPNVPLDLVAITKQTEFFSANQYQGILGMGAPANAEANTGAYITNATQAGMTPIMAFELCPTDGTMWLGGFDPSKATSAPQYTPLIAITDDQPFYAIDIDSMSLDGVTAGSGAAAFQEPVVDTGTTYFYLPTSIESALIAALNGSSAFKTMFNNATVKDDPNGTGVGCVTNASVTPAMVDAMLPPLKFSMPNKNGGADITFSVAPLESYLYDGGGGQYCLGIDDGGTQDATTMGDQIMQAFVTIIDQQNNQVGWAPDRGCGGAPRAARDRTVFHPHPPKRHRRHSN